VVKDADVEIDRLRAELLGIVESRLTPLARRYGYSESPLEDTIKWRPLVLVVGNYSSGKSTLINELLGAEVQQTGQAPTDDSFTIITYDEAAAQDGKPVRVTEEREGNVLLGDPTYPFAPLRRHGQRFASHFRLKKVTSPFLRSLAIVDTPGMIDAVTERDRGYDYQAVLGDLAQIADLVLVLFDAHKAGTLREAYASLRDTLPSRTFEDRVVFVLNRVDECENLNDLLRVYGTLCWNLSQMLGRKDIPPIRLTYSAALGPQGGKAPEYLRLLDNQRDDVRRLILRAPQFRLDHLASYVELHGERLAILAEGLAAFVKRRRRRILTTSLAGLGVGAALGVALGAWLFASGTMAGWDTAVWTGVATAAATALIWSIVAVPTAVKLHLTETLARPDSLLRLDTQGRRDAWGAVRDAVKRRLAQQGGADGKLPARELKADWDDARRAAEDDARRVRQTLGDLAARRSP
jgi:GTPase SAR1 family protein